MSHKLLASILFSSLSEDSILSFKAFFFVSPFLLFLYAFVSVCASAKTTVLPSLMGWHCCGTQSCSLLYLLGLERPCVGYVGSPIEFGS